MKKKNNSGKKGKWIKQDHLFGKPDYRCSLCGAALPYKAPVCPVCSGKNKRTVTNPVWVDEMEFYD